VLVFFLFLIALFFCFRRRKQKSRIAIAKSVSPIKHELFTNANSHELFTKHNIPEMDEQSSGTLKRKETLVQVVGGVRTENESAVPRDEVAGVQELDPQSYIIALAPENGFASAHELESTKLLAIPPSG
jgi:hypothetical protein